MRRRFFTMLFIMTAAGASASTLPFGTFVPTSATDQSCPDGFVCSGFEVSCPVSYALTHYGLETILDGVFPTGGPPHAAMAKSCLGQEGYGYPIETRNFLDRGFGFFDGNGPCARQDPSFIPRWNEESVATGGSDYYHPDTRIHFIFGEKDRPMQIVGGDYVARLRSAGSPLVTSVIAANTSHGVFRTPQGRAALRDAILGSPSPPPVRRRPARP